MRDRDSWIYVYIYIYIYIRRREREREGEEIVGGSRKEQEEQCQSQILTNILLINLYYIQ